MAGHWGVIETPYRYNTFYDDVILSPLVAQPCQDQQENKNMEKKFAVLTKASFTYKTYEEAEAQAKKWTARSNANDSYVVAQALSVVEAPVPAAVVTKL